MPLHSFRRPLWSTLAENIEKSLLADNLGYDELWVGEHLSSSSQPIQSPLMFLACMLSAHTVSTDTVASHWATYIKECAAIGRSPQGENWRVARDVLVAQSEAEARDRVFDKSGAKYYFYQYNHDTLRALGLSDPMTPEAMIKQYAIYGSPKLTLEKLIASRERTGPFGGLMITGLDWSGRNKDWESESMRLPAQHVILKFRQHIGDRTHQPRHG